MYAARVLINLNLSAKSKTFFLSKKIFFKVRNFSVYIRLWRLTELFPAKNNIVCIDMCRNLV